MKRRTKQALAVAFLVTLGIVAVGFAVAEVSDRMTGETAATARALASLCYRIEGQSYASSHVVDDIIERGVITDAEFAQIADMHTHEFVEKYPPPASRLEIDIDILTLCDMRLMTDEEQADVLRATREVADRRGGN